MNMALSRYKMAQVALLLLYITSVLFVCSLDASADDRPQTRSIDDRRTALAEKHKPKWHPTIPRAKLEEIMGPNAPSLRDPSQSSCSGCSGDPACGHCEDGGFMEPGESYYFDTLNWTYKDEECWFCYEYRFYPSRGDLSVTVGGIDGECNQVFLYLYPWNAAEVYDSAYNDGNNSVTAGYDVQEPDEWVAYVQYYCTEDTADAPWIVINMDRLDIDFAVTSFYDPYWGDDDYYESPENSVPITFYVRNMGSDDLPDGYGVEVKLYADATVDTSNWEYHSSVATDCFEIPRFDIPVTLWVNSGRTGEDWAVVAVVDPDNWLYEEGLSRGNNSAKVAEIYWDRRVWGTVDYFDWETWPGTGHLQRANADGSNLVVECKQGLDLLGRTTTDNYGDFSLLIPDSVSSDIVFEVYLPDSPGTCYIRDSATLTQVYTRSWADLPSSAPTIINCYQGFYPALDCMLNAGLNARETLELVQDFMDRELGYRYDMGEITFLIRHLAWGDCGAALTPFSSVITIPNAVPEHLDYARFITHELGHQVHCNWLPPGTTVEGTGDILSPETVGTDQQAFVEGWARFFSAIIPDVDTFAVAYTLNSWNPDYHAENIETNEWRGYPWGGVRYGSQYPWNIASVLFDLYDNTPGEEIYGCASLRDQWKYSFRDIYEALSSNQVAGVIDMVLDNPVLFLDNGYCVVLDSAHFNLTLLAVAGCSLTSVTANDSDSLLPTDFEVGTFYPNPFNSQCKVVLYLPQRGDLTVQLYNTLGQLVHSEVEEDLGAGEYTLSLDFEQLCSRNLASGVYLARISYGGQSRTRKLMLVK